MPASRHLYDILGVPPDADAEAVKRAYRAKAPDCHPDTGGTAEKFQELKRAYDILSDPEARKRYDETGDATAPMDKAGQAADMLTVMVLKLVEGEHDTRLDLVAALKLEVMQHEVRLREEKARVLATIRRMRYAAKRLKRKKGAGENMLRMVIEARIKQYEKGPPEIDCELEVRAEMARMLAEYECEPDAALPWAQPMPRHPHVPRFALWNGVET